MAFIVEDGTGLSNATSYVSVADADAYATDRGDTTWAALSTENKEIALIKATDYIDKNYTWLGTKNTREQALQWPRTDVVDANGFDIPSDEVPIEVKNATIEAALISGAGNDLYEATQIVKKEKVDVLEVEYLENGYIGSFQSKYPLIDDILKSLTTTTGNSGYFSRC